MPTPRNSDEAPDWNDDDGYIDITNVLQRLALTEDALFDALNEPLGSDTNETTD